MNDQERLTQRAKMGLRMLLKLHEAYPNLSTIIPRDAFAVGEKTEVDFSNISQWGEPIEPDIALAYQMIQRMVDEGVIRGQRNNRGVSEASLPSHTRERLNSNYSNGGGLRAAVIRAELAAGARGKPEILIRVSREIGFEP